MGLGKILVELDELKRLKGSKGLTKGMKHKVGKG